MGTTIKFYNGGPTLPSTLDEGGLYFTSTGRLYVGKTGQLIGENLDNLTVANSIKDNSSSIIGTKHLAFGNNLTTGVKGYKINEISIIYNDTFNGYEITLLYADTGYEGGGVSGWSSGDIISLHCDYEWDACATIVYTDYGHIYVDTLPQWILEGNYSISSNKETLFTNHVVWNVTQPTIGDIDISTGIIATGKDNVAYGSHSFVAGNKNIALGSNSFVVGTENTGAYASFVVGRENTALGKYCTAIGRENTAGAVDQADVAYAEGHYCKALAECSHAEGYNVSVEARKAHGEGVNNNIYTGPEASHIEGGGNKIYGAGTYTIDDTSVPITAGTLAGNATNGGTYSHVEGLGNISYRAAAHAEGCGNIVSGLASHAEGRDNYAKGNYSHVEGNSNKASGINSHAEGESTEAIGQSAHTEGVNTEATGLAAHAEGKDSSATAPSAHAEGNVTRAEGLAAHAEGYNTKATRLSTHAEGYTTIAGYDEAAYTEYGLSDDGYRGSYAHAEGQETKALNYSSHAEGKLTVSVGTSAHAGGENSLAIGNRSFAHGYYVKAKASNQFVIGKYNADNANALFIIGNGTADSTEGRTNLFEVTTNDGVKYKGNKVATPNIIEVDVPTTGWASSTTYGYTKIIQDDNIKAKINDNSNIIVDLVLTGTTTSANQSQLTAFNKISSVTVGTDSNGEGLIRLHALSGIPSTQIKLSVMVM